jgi:hypothetical protein
MHLLIDADILVFRSGFAAERNVWFLNIDSGNFEAVPEQYAYKKEALAALDEALPGKYSRVEGEDYQLWSERYLEPVENALHNLNGQVNKILEALSCTEFDVTMYLSGGKNYRYDIAKTRPYKGNRDDAHRPQHEEAIRKYIRSKWETVVTDGIEADDALGIEQTRNRTNPSPMEDTCIVSIDKDLDMIPGLHYNFMHDVSYEVTTDDAWKCFCKQVLTGDTTDNIPGLKGIGSAKAEKMLDGLEHGDLLEEVARQYAAKSGKKDWFAYMTEQAQLLWIQRETDDLFTFPEEFKELGGGQLDDDIQLEMY